MDGAASSSSAESDRKLNDVNIDVQSQVSPVLDQINITLQQAYFKCAYECIDRSKEQDEIKNCVDHCSVPVQQALDLVRKFEERLKRALTVWEDESKTSKPNRKAI